MVLDILYYSKNFNIKILILYIYKQIVMKFLRMDSIMSPIMNFIESKCFNNVSIDIVNNKKEDIENRFRKGSKSMKEQI
jgi:hypothetical protein